MKTIERDGGCMAEINGNLSVDELAPSNTRLPKSSTLTRETSKSLSQASNDVLEAAWSHRQTNLHETNHRVFRPHTTIDKFQKDFTPLARTGRGTATSSANQSSCADY